MWSRKFWAAAGERATRAAAWYVLSTVGVVNNVVHHAVPWSAVGIGTATVFGLSVMASIAGSGVGASNSPSLLPESIDPPAPRRRK